MKKTDDKLKTELNAMFGASLGGLAISTSEHVALKQSCVRTVYQPNFGDGGPVSRVYEWSASHGIQEIAICEYVNPSDPSSGMTRRTQRLNSSTQGVMLGSNFIPEHADENHYDGEGSSGQQRANFALDFIENYRDITSVPIPRNGRAEHIVIMLRNWDRAIGMNGVFIDRQLRLLDEVSDPSSRLRLEQRIIPTIIMHSSGSWKDTKPDGTAMVPKELKESLRLFDYLPPNKEDRTRIVRREIDAYSGQFSELATVTDEQIETIADATAGLTRKNITDLMCISISLSKNIDIPLVLEEKRKMVSDAGYRLLRPDAGFESIGGLSPLKDWIQKIAPRFTDAAREYGFLQTPRGLLMAGIPGCGKTAIAKAMAKELNMNILMVDATDLKGSLVGQSEGKVRKLLQTAEAAAPLIVFVDEAEKLLGKQEGSLDGGAHAAVLGQFLTFMQENDSGVFFVFTANNMSAFAPELVDRFPGRYFIDLPKPVEREAIFKIHLTIRGKDWSDFDIGSLTAATKGFSGRNIEDVITEAMTNAFYEEGRELTTEDILAVIREYKPTSETKADDIKAMRAYVKDGLMRTANDPGKGESRSKRNIIPPSGTDESRINSIPTDDF